MSNTYYKNGKSFNIKEVVS